MDKKIIKTIGEYAVRFSEKKFIESGYIAMREADGIAITAPKADLRNVGEDSVVFVNDKNIETYEGNFRAAAVILFCAIRQDKTAEVAAIVDSEAILQYSCKRKPLQPNMDNVAKLLGATVKCSSKNVASEIVTSLTGCRNACFMPDAGAVVKARGFDELLQAVDVLDKACNAEILAEDKGGTMHLNPVNALLEQAIYRLTTRSKYATKVADGKDSAESVEQSKQAEAESGDNGQASEQSQETAQADNASEQAQETATESDSQNQQSAEGDNCNEQSQQTVTDDNSNGQTQEPVTEDNNSQAGEQPQEPMTEDNSNSQSNEVAEVREVEVVRKIFIDGKTACLACPRYVTAVSAIGKPMAVTDEYKDKFGEEINCLPSKIILSDKAFEKTVALTGEAKVCFLAQHGVIIKADGDEDLKIALADVESACKAYFETNSASVNGAQ